MRSSVFFFTGELFFASAVNAEEKKWKKEEFFYFEPTNQSYSNPDGNAQTPRTGRCVDWIRFSIDDSQATPALFGLFEIIQSTIKLTLERPRGKAAVQLWNRFSEADDFSLLAKVAVAYLRVSLHAGEWLRRIDDDDDDDSDSDVD
ncbi:conserved hypothetical protein [Trichinella spiralis]|uniref:hypothetical protein n=1 Tax=Trichinella spiralis TaxID=6334 RepID=UPI0001EFBD29|nr:conserved hypothetical protein [Trichinella spiralis]